MIKKQIEELRKFHNHIKEHPYWKTFDKDLLPELGKEFYHSPYIPINNTNPYNVVLKGISHDFHCMCRNFDYYISSGIYDKYKDAYIVTLQAYLQNLHMLIDSKENQKNETAVAYLPDYNVSNTSHLMAFISEWFDDEQQYRCLNLISKKSIEGVKEYLLKLSSLKGCKNTVKWAKESLQDISDDKDIIGKFWKIKKY